MTDQRPKTRSLVRLAKPLGVVAVLGILFAALMGVALAGKATIGDFVWHDLDGDGVQDANEPGINGVVVELYNNGTLISTTTTITNPDVTSPGVEDQGWYLFNVDLDETYTVAVAASNFAPNGALEGYVLTENTDSNVSNEDDSNPNPSTSAYIDPGDSSTWDQLDIDFGFARPDISIVKTAGNAIDGATEYISGTQDVTYYYTVTNVGETWLHDIQLTDDTCSNIQGPAGDTGGIFGGDGEMSLGETWTFSCTTSVSTSITNTAVVTGTPTDSDSGNPPEPLTQYTGGPTVQATDSDKAVVEVVHPAIDIQKTVYHGHDGGASCPGGEKVVGALGDNITYCFEVTNEGDTYLNVTIDDGTLGIDTSDLTPNTSTLLAPGASTTYYYETTITDDLVNTATATGNPTDENGNDLPDIPDVTDEDDAEVEYLRGAIGDYVWYDTDRDGWQDVDERGIGNVTVVLYKDNGNGSFGAGDAIIATRVTDNDGGYLFTDLEPGTYFVQVTDDFSILNGLDHIVANQSLPSPTGAITIGSGGIYRDADFGYAEQQNGNAYVGDYVWYDYDEDGVQDPGEPGIPGVTVQIKNSTGTVIASDETDANGFYLVEVTPGSGYTAAPDPGDPQLTNLSPTTPQPLSLPDLAPNDVYLDADFGYNRTNDDLGVIGDEIWHDPDGDGVRETGEPGIPGVSVSLIRDTNDNGIYEAGTDRIFATDTTDQNGAYLFQGVPAGDYLVLVTDTQNVLKDYEPTTATNNAAEDVSKPTPYRIDNFPIGGSVLYADFGYVLRQVDDAGIVGNQVWFELDVDGVYEPDDGDVGIEGVTMELRDSGGVIATTTTGASGDYVFTSLPAGTYTVTIANDAANAAILGDYIPTLYVGGTDDNDNKYNQYVPGVTEYSVTIAADGINMTADAGYTRKSTLGDYVWWDDNGNDTQDADEQGIPDVVVQLWEDDGSGTPQGAAPVMTTTTDADGFYFFTGLNPYTQSEYVIQIDPAEFQSGGTLENWTGVTPNPSGGDDAKDSDGVAAAGTYRIDADPLAVAEIDLTNDFGFEIATDYTVSKTLTSQNPHLTTDAVVFVIEVTNNGPTHLATVPLTDTFYAKYLSFNTAQDKDGGTVTPTSGPTDPSNPVTDTTDAVYFADLTGGDQLAPGETISITLFFDGSDTSQLTGSEDAATCAGRITGQAEFTCNLATVSNPDVDPDGPSGPLTPEETNESEEDTDIARVLSSTSVGFESYGVQMSGGQATVYWTTISEVDIARFHLYRAVNGGEAVKVFTRNAEKAGQPGGHRYEWTDSNVPTDATVVYTLETEMLSGGSEYETLGELGHEYRIFVPMAER